MAITTVSFSPNTIIKSADVNTNFSNITTAIPWNSNPISAKGNILAGTAASTASALTVGTDGQVLTADSTQSTGMKWSTPATSPTSQATTTNLGLTASVNSNALTITLTQADGATTPSSGSPVTVSFRNSTSSTGGYSTVSVTSSILLTVPNGASLGHVSGKDQYVWVYAINNAGALELAVSGVKVFDDYSIQSTTAISGSATSGTVMYSTTSRSSVGIRLIGRILVNEVSAGVWAAAVTEVSLVSGRQPASITDWVAYTPTFQGFGTVASVSFWSRRDGDSLEIMGNWTNGTTAASQAQITLGYNGTNSNVTIDSTKMSVSRVVGDCIQNQNSAAMIYVIAVGPNGYLQFGYQGSANAAQGAPVNGNAVFSGSAVQSLYAKVPITGWAVNSPL
jgi:hypothetical protein